MVTFSRDSALFGGGRLHGFILCSCNHFWMGLLDGGGDERLTYKFDIEGYKR